MLLNVFSFIVTICTLFLIFAGGMVTSTQSSLSVPDWPLSYGRLMPPMVGGIFYEHGHRMIAGTVGLLTITLALLFTFKETRSWVKRAAWCAVCLVVVQAVLGGVTVLLRLPKPISILHACTAQTFLSLVTALTVWTTRTWKEGPALRVDAPRKIPLHHITTGLFAAVYIQLIIGAILRHTGYVFILHIAQALVVFTLASMTLTRLRHEPSVLRIFSRVIFAVVLLQISIGITSYLMLAHNFDVIPVPLYVPIIVSAHVVTGALILSLSAAQALLAYKTRPSGSQAVKTKLTDYVQLTKPGISFMAGVTAFAGFILGSNGSLEWSKLFHTTVGTLLISAGAGAFNMLMERDTDARMRRTQTRPLPSGRMNTGEVLFFGTLLSGSAIAYLAWSVNLLTALLATLAFSIYLYIYTPLKKVSPICTLAGAVAGALPPVIGWSAATGTVGIEALILFGIIFFWQFPHFFSLAWLYKDDYAGAGLRMLPRPSDNGWTAAISMVLNSVALLVVSILPTSIGLTGHVYQVVAFLAGLSLLIPSVAFLFDRSRLHARRVFFASLFYVPLLVVFMVLNKAASL
jgi:protoheme IX farnesyltransferase